ncbi:MAG TPA: hypothetical protein VMC79_04720 [Rectinemataceae bacterium]|nr:hypothetical protein [Rectinemataceae bacterium]
MHHAPLASTMVALGLLPVAVLYVHTFISGFKRLPGHRVTGLIAVMGDLALSIGYMLYRSFGGRIGDSVFRPTGLVLDAFIVHGMIAVIVILLELWVIVSAVHYHRTKTMYAHHRWMSKLMFVLWSLTFLSGELVYIALYIA